MIEFLAAADSHWAWTLFGRLHPLTVHFPIALLLVAALVEGWGIVRRRTAAGDTAWLCVGLGTLSAIASTIMGYAFADSKIASDDLEMHERLGLITTIVAALTAVLAWRARRMGGTGGPALAYRSFLFAAALGVSVTGHYGGELVYGNWLFDDMPWEKKEPLQKAPDPASPTPAAGTVDFEKDIAPIIKASCLKCHSPAKTKGKLRLHAEADALKKSIKPGKPAESTFYTLLVTDNEDERMPSEADPLPKEQIELVKKWIEQGAPWPDGFEIK